MEVLAATNFNQEKTMAENKTLRLNLKNYLLAATVEVCWIEYDLSRDRDDLIRAKIIRELIIEWFPNELRSQQVQFSISNGETVD